MKTKNTLLVIALSGILAACGSSSSQGTTAPSSSSTTGGSTTGGSTSGGSTSGGSTSGGSTSGGSTSKEVGIVVRDDSGDDEAAAPYFSTFDNGDGDINTITINGHAITLIPSYVSSGGFYSESQEGSTKIVSGNNFRYSRFGVVDIDTNEVNAFGLFSQGTATTDMPSSGNATYAGRAVGAVDNSSFDNGFTTGNSSLTVNFGTKTVTGTLNGWENAAMPTLAFSATISGNSFSGNTVRGQFYGPAAVEVGGAVNTTHNGNAAVASFGATKQ